MSSTDTPEPNVPSAPTNQEKDFTKWFNEHWYLVLFPTFVFAFGIRWGITTCNPGTIGFACALLLAHQVSQMQDAERGKRMTFIVPLIFLAAVLIIPIAGEARDPYLDLTARIGRASISGAFSVLLLVISVGITKIFKKP
ncbi:MAG: hypothetical protein SXV54_07710 [Chloroflexota bacterium]|nr:hypothetical protein [Chloroflexota bacterium]